MQSLLPPLGSVRQSAGPFAGTGWWLVVVTGAGACWWGAN